MALEDTAMRTFHAIAPTVLLARVADVLARYSPANGLANPLTWYSDADLDRALEHTGRHREDLFRQFRGNARHRHLMAHMIEHFGVDLEHAVRHDWDRLKHADGVCVECSTIRRCRSWIAWGRHNDAARVFCPNAALFDELAQAMAGRRTPAKEKPEDTRH